MRRARHDSMIVDTFQGQHVTTRECPSCGCRGRKFEAYMYITAPIPGSDLTTRQFMLLSVGGSKPPLVACVRLRAGGCVAAFVEAAAGIADIEPSAAAERVAVATWNDKMLNVLDDPNASLPTGTACAPDSCVAILVAAAGCRLGQRSVVRPLHGRSGHGA
jgi:hypothetical protein